MKAEKFQTLKEAREHTQKAREMGLSFETHKFATKRKFKFFSGTNSDWLLAIS